MVIRDFEETPELKTEAPEMFWRSNSRPKAQKGLRTGSRPCSCQQLARFLNTVLSRLTFPRAKSRRHIFLTGRNPGRRVGRKIGRYFGRNFLGIFVLHSLCRTTHQNFSPNPSQSITPCLVMAPVTEFSKFHLHELLGLGVPKVLDSF